jgi:hypothetical protein
VEEKSNVSRRALLQVQLRGSRSATAACGVAQRIVQRIVQRIAMQRDMRPAKHSFCAHWQLVALPGLTGYAWDALTAAATAGGWQYLR